MGLVGGACRGQKRALEPRGLELQISVSPEVDGGKWTWILWKYSQCSKLPSQLSSPTFYRLLCKGVEDEVHCSIWNFLSSDTMADGMAQSLFLNNAFCDLNNEKLFSLMESNFK